MGFILNQYNGCLKECCTKGDKFIIEFPESAELFHKILIVYATVVIDYNMFENCCFNLP